MPDELDRETEIIDRLQMIAKQSREIINLHKKLDEEFRRLKDELENIRAARNRCIGDA